MNKHKIFDYLRLLIEAKIDKLVKAVESIAIEMSNETKSSAGDKFETSREMMNQERDRLEKQIQLANIQLKSVEQMTKLKRKSSVDVGSLVCCEEAIFLFGVAYGKLSWKEIDIQVLSLNSPLGRVFYGKNVGDEIPFLKQQYHITAIY